MKKIYKLSFLILVLQFVNVQITFSQAPVINAVQGQTIVCSTGNIAAAVYSVTASNNPTSYYWTVFNASDGSATFASPSASSTSVSFSTTSGVASFTLMCVAYNGSGVSSPIMLVVKVFETPSVTFSGVSTLCQGGSGNISASSTSSTLFQSSSTTIFWAPATGLSSTSSPSVIANPPATTNYTILTSFGPCTTTNYFLVTVTPAPSVSAMFTPSVICKGEKSILNLSGTALSYSVNGALTSISSSYSPTQNTSYTVNGTGTGSCQSTASVVSLVVNPCTGINDYTEEKSRLYIYPNPSNGTFKLKSETDAHVVIVNELGQQVKTLHLNASSETAISGLSAGIYFVVSKTEKKKIVVTP
ncbi:hypothetical protein CNR22_05965 [Sphingobacteriaceae bacterium]|nr:hypothetical protein CNR22_05965 [Sphingobacteriaceae bacterium]